MERQLRAILAMDVVGFSKMMSEDEENTLRVLTDRRQVVDQIINEHGGRIFNTAGDSVIAEFASPVKAAECAVQIQNKNSTINKDLNEKIYEVYASINPLARNPWIRLHPLSPLPNYYLASRASYSNFYF